MKNSAFILIGIASSILSACHTPHTAKIGSQMDTIPTVPMDTLKSETVSPIQNVNLQLELYQKGVRQYTFNSSENWNVTIIPEKGFEFCLGDETFSFPYVTAAIAMDANLINYKTKNATKEILSITISQQPLTTCEDGTDSASYPFSGTVIFTDRYGKETVRSGCGFYLVNPILNDIWALESLDGKAIDKTSYTNGVPVLEFHMNGMTVHGFGGCNQLNGSFYIDQDKLVFSNMAATLKMCEHMESEIQFLNAVNNKSYSYIIENLKLKLTHKNGSILVFKKVD